VHGWVEDQRWTLAPVTRPVFGMLGLRYTPRAVSHHISTIERELPLAVLSA
jgi:hypothetical protein